MPTHRAELRRLHQVHLRLRLRLRHEPTGDRRRQGSRHPRSRRHLLLVRRRRCHRTPRKMGDSANFHSASETSCTTTARSTTTCWTLSGHSNHATHGARRTRITKVIQLQTKSCATARSTTAFEPTRHVRATSRSTSKLQANRRGRTRTARQNTRQAPT